ncbi:MAG: PspC domain-containing protein [Bacteroidaceae bacterium]|nr:PspC domain-containing protein [Bacteroidaceae bacterium]
MDNKKFYLSSTDKKIAGVCGGLAEYFEVDALIIRVLFIAAILEFGTGLLAYFVLWILAPKR